MTDLAAAADQAWQDVRASDHGPLTIMACKVVRDRTNCSLREAADALRESKDRAYVEATATNKASVRQSGPLADFARWLIAMDDPEDPAGITARQTVTLSRIIDRAREALGVEV